jgi:hypothetical protein
MGVDAVELIIGWEKAFGIEISDEEAIALQTPKMAIDLICDKVGAGDEGSETCPAMRSYHAVRQALQAVLGLQRHEIKLNSKLRLLVPKTQRQQAWNQIRSEMGIPKLPSFGFGVGAIFRPITVRDLVDWSVANYPSHFMDFDGRWTRFQVRSVVRTVIRYVVRESDFKDDNDFYREIGIGL